LLATVSAHAAVSLGSPGAFYSQSFDILASAGNANVFTNDVTLPGIGLYTLANVPVTAYNAGTGSSSTGAAYSFGATGSGERALGSVASGNFSGYIALSLTNDTSVAFDSFTVRYDGEQWRNGGNTTAQSLAVEYGFGASASSFTWIPSAALTFTSPVTGATAAAVDGNVAGLVAGITATIPVSWAPGSTLWVRWVDINDTGNDHGLGIDNLNVSVTAVPEPGTTALLLAGLAAVGLIARRRA
jgi:hypothetical protein